MQPVECNRTVLVVDDEPHHVSGMHRLLQRLDPSLTVQEAFYGAQALDIIWQAPPRMVITDVCMEDMDGLTLIERIGEKRRAGMCIVMMSAFDKFSYVQRAMRLGAVDYLLKPVDENEVRRVLRRFGPVEGEPGAPDGADHVCDQTLQSIVQYIQANYGADLSLEQIADMFHYNANYLSVRFKQRTGVSFSQFVRQVRMRRAEKLLEGTNMLISDIASEVGYRDPGYFIRTFRQAHDASPEKYRRIARRAL